MSEASEFMERMEHAGHSGHGHGDDHSKAGPGKQIGITMAMLGVMLALCAALVGAHRTDLIKTTVEQSNKWGIYQAETMKFRIIEGDLEMLKALTPKASEREELKADLLKHGRPNGTADDEDTAEIKGLIAESTDDMARLLTPDQKEEDRFTKLAREYEDDVKEAKEDAEAYDEAIEGHQGAAEWYERAQLLAEVGIVVASIALLMSSKKIWLVAVVLGLAGGGIIGFTFVKTRKQLIEAEEKIEKALKDEGNIEKQEEEEDQADEKAAEADEAAASAAEKKPEAKAPEESASTKPSAASSDKKGAPEGGAGKPEGAKPK